MYIDMEPVFVDICRVSVDVTLALTTLPLKIIKGVKVLSLAHMLSLAENHSWLPGCVW